MMEDYVIVVPSRKRPKNAANVLRMLPNAIIYIDEREKKDYSDIPAANVRFHKPTKNLPQVRNLMVHDFEEPAIIYIEDDLVGVRMARDEFRKLYKDTVVLMDVLENGLQCAEDAGVGLFCWNRSRNPMMYRPFDPITFVAPVVSTYVQRGSARYRKFEEVLHGRADVEFTLRSLLEDRIVMQDRRFYFDVGPVFSGKGGSVDLIDEKQYARATDLITEKWGRYVRLTDPSRASNKRATRRTKQGMGLRVRRKSPIARNDLL